MSSMATVVPLVVMSSFGVSCGSWRIYKCHNHALDLHVNFPLLLVFGSLCLRGPSLLLGAPNSTAAAFALLEPAAQVQPVQLARHFAAQRELLAVG